MSVTPTAPSPNSCSQLMVVVVVVVVWWVEMWVDSAAGRRMKVSGDTEAFPERGEAGSGAGAGTWSQGSGSLVSTLWRQSHMI